MDHSQHYRGYVERGHWTEAGTIGGVLHALRMHAERAPDQPMLVDRLGALSRAAMADKVARAAQGLADLGVVRGDCVLIHLPNWHEAFLLHLAAESIGAITVPAPLIYRAAEVLHIATLTSTKVAFIAEWGSFDFIGMYRDLKRELPALRHVIAVTGGGALSHDLFAASRYPAKQLQSAATLPDSIVHIGFTSGSTGRPKGAVHTSNTACAEHRAWLKAFAVSSSDVVLVVATVGHQLGFAMTRAAAMAGAKIVFLDKWEPIAAMQLIARERVTLTFTTPTFLYDMITSPSFDATELASLRTWILAGQVVTSQLRQDATASLPHVRFAPLFGMTEMGCVVMCDEATPVEKLVTTGRAQLGVELDVIGPSGCSVGYDCDGELVIRGPSVLLHYFENPEATAAAFTPDGFFKTGDQARCDAEGFITITGRIKDLIRRGGESISPAEVENLLARHPKVAEASIVGVADARLGERICAFVVPPIHDPVTVTLEELRGFAAEHGLTRQKWPERLEIVATLPRTSIGKVDKAVLRARLEA